MPSKPATRRMQRAAKSGKSIPEIAAKEGVSERTVARAVHSKQFQRHIVSGLFKTANLQLEASHEGLQLASLIVKKALEEAKNPKSRRKFTMKDVADLGKFAHLMHQQGVDYLKDAIKRGQEQMDEQLKKDSQILETTANEVTDHESVPA